MVSQLPVNEWYEVLQESIVARAIRDRVIHTSHRIELKGESLRKKGKNKVILSAYCITEIALSRGQHPPESLV